MPKAKAPAKARGGGAAAPAPAPAAPAGAELEVPALEAQVKKEEARVKKLTTMLAKANDALAVCRDRLAKAKGIEAVGRDWRDWAALPDNVLKRVATILAQDADADYEARLAPYAGALVVRRSGGNVEHRWPCKAEGFPNGRSTSGLLFFALACRGWRNAQRELGPLRTRLSDVLVHDKLELFHLFRAGKNPMPKRWTPPYNTPFVYLYDKDLAQVAASCGALECLKWMHAKKDQGWKGLKSHSPVNFSALRAGQKKVFEWMYQIYKDGDEKAIGCLYEADDHNLDISCGAVTVAAYSGNLALVTWLVENGHYTHVRAAQHAAACGHIHIMSYLFTVGLNRTPNFLDGFNGLEVCNEAAGAGQLEALKFAVSQGCEANEATVAWAVNNRQWGVVKWLRTMGCPIHVRHKEIAEKHGYTDSYGAVVDYEIPDGA